MAFPASHASARSAIEVLFRQPCFGYIAGQKAKCDTHRPPQPGDLVLIETSCGKRPARFRGRFVELADGRRMIGCKILGVLFRITPVLPCALL